MMLAWLALRLFWLVLLAAILPELASAVPAEGALVDQALEPVEVPTVAILPLVWAVVSAIAALLVAAIPAKKMPAWLLGILNALGSNWGNAKNAPTAGQAAATRVAAAGGSR